MEHFAEYPHRQHSGEDEPVPSLIQHALFRVTRALIFRGIPEPPLDALPIAQLRCLHTIACHEGKRLHDLAERLEIKQPAMSQIVDRLVKRGLIERRCDTEDRRAVQLYLTPMAEEAMHAARDARRGRMTATLEFLSAADRAQVEHGLRLLAGAAESAEAADRARERQQRIEQPVSADGDPLVEIVARRSRQQRRNLSAKSEVAERRSSDPAAGGVS